MIAAPLALSACASSKSTPSASHSPTTVVTKTTVPTDPRLSVKNNVAARKDVTLSNCEVTNGSWQASGTVTNSTSATATYTLQITYTNSGGTVQDVEKTTVTPNAKQTVPWSTTWTSSVPSGINCILDAVSRS